MTGKKMICCFGELLFRFSPEMQGGFIYKQQMPVFIGGAELNAAQALSLWGEKVRYVTALPSNYLAEELVGFIEQKKIDVSFIEYCGERIGSYYLPQGKDLKHNAVIYDRAHSSFAGITPGQLDWNLILNNVEWFHFSAISPALNEQVADVCLEAVKAAKARGITVSIDLNYRSKLWQYGKRPAAVMTKLLPYCDVVMGNIWAAQQLLDINASIKASNGRSNDELSAAAKESMRFLKNAFPNVNTIAYTFRLDQHYFACLHHGENFTVSREYKMNNIIDKVGSGDCFMGGLIYCLVNDKPQQYIIDFAAAAAILKLSQTGDATSSSLADVENKIQDHE